MKSNDRFTVDSEKPVLVVTIARLVQLVQLVATTSSFDSTAPIKTDSVELATVPTVSAAATDTTKATASRFAELTVPVTLVELTRLAAEPAAEPVATEYCYLLVIS